jgi:hypothetical protein
MENCEEKEGHVSGPDFRVNLNAPETERNSTQATCMALVINLRFLRQFPRQMIPAHWRLVGNDNAMFRREPGRRPSSELVDQARDVVTALSTDELRKNANLRKYITDEMNHLRISVDGALEDCLVGKSGWPLEPKIRLEVGCCQSKISSLKQSIFLN